jgi:hypothetical protein
VPGLQSFIALKRNLGSAALTVAVLILFVGLVLTALLLLILAGLTALLALSWLSGLSALLALSGLATFLLRIVCHRIILLKKRGRAAPLRFKRNLRD